MVQKVLTVADFDRILDDFAGRQTTHTPTTKTTSNFTGEETLTEGSPVVIKCHFVKTDDKYVYEKSGLTQVGNAIMLAKVADTVTKDSKITVDSQDYRVKEAYNVAGIFDSTGSGTVNIYTVCSLKRID